MKLIETYERIQLIQLNLWNFPFEQTCIILPLNEQIMYALKERAFRLNEV